MSPQSIHDLLALRACIAEDDPVAAKGVALHILYCVEHLLAENPQLGHPGRVYGTRELVIPKTPFVVPYRVRDNALEILRVYHHASRWPERLQPLPRDNQSPSRRSTKPRTPDTLLSLKIRDVPVIQHSRRADVLPLSSTQLRV